MYDPAAAIDVVLRLRRRWPDVHLTMVGPDRGDGSLAVVRKRIADLHLKTAITIIPGLPSTEIPAVLNQADIFLNTSIVDNTPVSVLEAMASGLCVVSTNAGGLRYLLNDGRDALLTPPGDTDALAAAVDRILTQDHFAARLSESARAAVESLDWTNVLPRWEALLRASYPTTPRLRNPNCSGSRQRARRTSLADPSRPATRLTTQR
jgi:glycosyltransferase involved in cell wall biosynthesis